MQDVNPRLADIRREWDWVRPGIEEIIAETPMPWRPEDVYAACIHHSADLFVTDAGFVVTTIETDAASGTRSYLIWLAWAKEKGGANAAMHQDFFANMAAECGCSRMLMRSAVRELEPYMTAIGWDVNHIEYVRHL